jgi:outer membrane protein insertion porin family
VLDTFELKTPNWLSWYKQDDRYSRESLTGDLEKLRSYYMDRGYANFQIESTQVTIAPEKDDMYITVNVNEGEVFKVSEIKLAGTMVVPEEQLRKLLLIKPGDIFFAQGGHQLAGTDELPARRRRLRLRQDRSGADARQRQEDRGAHVLHRARQPRLRAPHQFQQHHRDQRRNAAPRNAPAGRRLAVEFRDRALQGAHAALPYVEKVEFENKPVAGSADLVDVDYNIKEGLPGQFGGGIGYSEAQKFSLNGNFVHSNFMGTGDRIALEINAGKYSKSYTFSHTDPYTTIDGVARTDLADLSRHHAVRRGLIGVLDQADHRRDEWSYPITEYQYLQAGVSANKNSWWSRRATARSRPSIGSRTTAIPSARPGRYQRRRRHQFAGQSLHGVRHRLLHLRADRRLESRYAQPRAVRRPRHAHDAVGPLRAAAERRALLRHELQFLQVHSAVGQVAAVVQREHGLRLGARQDHLLPPYLNYFAGGPDSVRGYRESTLGSPRQHRHRQSLRRQLARGEPLELIFPVPEKWKSAARVSWFYDMGNVF